MDRPSDSQTSTQKDASADNESLSYKKFYLVIYNAASMMLWQIIMFRVILFGSFGGVSVYHGAGEFTKWTQTFAALEIVHSLLGMFTSTDRRRIIR